MTIKQLGLKLFTITTLGLLLVSCANDAVDGYSPETDIGNAINEPLDASTDEPTDSTNDNSTNDNSGDASNDVNEVGFPGLVYSANISDAGDDSDDLNLNGVYGIVAAKVDGINYVLAAGHFDSGISLFHLKNDGTLANLDNVSDDDDLKIRTPRDVTAVEVGGNTYFFVGGYGDRGISVFSIGESGNLINVNNLSDDGTLRIFSPEGLTTAKIGQDTYFFAAGGADSGVSVFRVNSDGSLVNTTNVSDAGNVSANLELYYASGVATAEVGGETYLFVAARWDDGVSVFRVESDGGLVNTDNVADDDTLYLDGSEKLTTAEVGGITYLYVTGYQDSGLSIFRVENGGTLVNVHNLKDDETLSLQRPSHIITENIEGVTYIFVSALSDGVGVFRVESDGSLVNVANLDDDSNLNLDSPRGMATIKEGEETYFIAAGYIDDGLSAFNVNTILNMTP